jgi:hypothetical protein
VNGESGNEKTDPKERREGGRKLGGRKRKKKEEEEEKKKNETPAKRPGAVTDESMTGGVAASRATAPADTFAAR